MIWCEVFSVACIVIQVRRRVIGALQAIGLHNADRVYDRWLQDARNLIANYVEVVFAFN